MTQAGSRNQTGAFLAMEAMSDQRQASHPSHRTAPKIPPLQKGRGRLTQTSAEISRHKKVEAIRERESYKGFTGLSLNTARRPKTSPALCASMRRSKQSCDIPSSEDIYQLIRPNPRQFTAVNNHGVTHREYLLYNATTGHHRNHFDTPVNLATSLAQTSAMQGPTQYYNTLCKNNPEALKTLLNNKKFGWPTNQYTGFHVQGNACIGRSYKKPTTLRIVADLDSTSTSSLPHSRPKTAASTALLSSRELLVPQPFIYRSSSNASRREVHKPAPPAITRQKSQTISFADDVDELFVPDEKKLNTSMEIGEGIASVPTGAVESNENDVDVNCVASSSPVDNTLTSNLIGRFDKAMPIMKKTLVAKEPLNSTNENVSNQQPITQSTKHPFKPQINIAIETEDGNIQPLEIDDSGDVFHDEVYKSQSPDCEEPLVHRNSISERIQKMKLGEDAAKSMKIEAQQRKQILQNLLEEHQHIVRQVELVDSKENTH